MGVLLSLAKAKEDISDVTTTSLSSESENQYKSCSIASDSDEFDHTDTLRNPEESFLEWWENLRTTELRMSASGQLGNQYLQQQSAMERPWSFVTDEVTRLAPTPHKYESNGINDDRNFSNLAAAFHNPRHVHTISNNRSRLNSVYDPKRAVFGQSNVQTQPSSSTNSARISADRRTVIMARNTDIRIEGNHSKKRRRRHYKRYSSSINFKKKNYLPEIHVSEEIMRAISSS